MTIKQQAHDFIESLSEELTVKELESALYDLIDQLKIEEGLKASAEGLTINHGKVKQRMTRLTSN